MQFCLLCIPARSGGVWYRCRRTEHKTGACSLTSCTSRFLWCKETFSLCYAVRDVSESGFHRENCKANVNDAICLYDPTREKAVRENPQIFPNCKL